MERIEQQTSTMVERYIAPDGSIRVRAPKPPGRLQRLQRFLFATPERTAVMAAVVACCLKFDVFHWRQNPLAEGRIPASARQPNEHWSAMAEDMIFVRTMTEALGLGEAKTEMGANAIHRSKLNYVFEGADFGGPDGRVAESIDWSDMESIRVTRCSTTKDAITAYMCGAEVATNMDVGKLGSQSHKTPNSGITFLKDYIQCRHQQGSKRNSHRRSVYRIGIGSNDHLSGYSHVFSIVAQPDGTFLWLQSFVGHYSLTTWMKQKDQTKTSGLSGHLTFPELLQKFQKMERLMSIDSWTDQANDDYLDLFNVDKRKESLGDTRARTTVYKWNLDHRLDHFGWDEACEYPLPEDDENISMATAHEGDDAKSNQSPPQENDIDECAIEHIALNDLLKKLEERPIEHTAWTDHLKELTKDMLDHGYGTISIYNSGYSNIETIVVLSDTMVNQEQ